MSFITDHKQKFDDLRSYLVHQDQIRKRANGGNSILFSYPPGDDDLYIAKAQELYPENASFIDVSQLLVRFIEQDGWGAFKDYYHDFRNTPHVIFKSDDPDTDLFDLIIHEIEAAAKKNIIPFIVRTGCLYGTGIENVNIMEHKSVMELPSPLVIFYPSRIEDDNLYFLNFKLASKYRCVLVK